MGSKQAKSVRGGVAGDSEDMVDNGQDMYTANRDESKCVIGSSKAHSSVS
jgi:hypothetical protein